MAPGGDLSLVIEELISRGATDFEISRAVKQEIKRHFDTLDELFMQDAGKNFLVQHTRSVDTFLTILYKYLLRDTFGDYQPGSNVLPITLVALGSYGREQLTVYSDIDLMIVYKEIKGYNLKPMIERYLLLLWDAGLKIGHRVHEVGELFDVAHTDITIKTAMLESRYLYGSRFLWTEIQNQLSSIRHHGRPEYIAQKLEEYQARHRKYPIAMEPYIKEGAGGLRDANTLFWIATALFGVSSNKDLAGRIYSDDEYREYRIALEFLYKVRTALHLVAGKKQDRLIFQLQREVALKMGFRDTVKFKAERQFISRTLNALGVIYRFTAIYADRLSRRPYVTMGPIGRGGYQRIGERLFMIGSMLAARRSARPGSLGKALKTLVQTPDSGWRHHPSMLYYLGRLPCASKVSATFKGWVWRLFFRKHTYGILTLLREADRLGTVIPPMQKVLDLAQFDGYHHYPVDLHSVRCVAAIETLRDPFLLEIWETLEPKERALLKLVILLHDAGKGRKGDHSEIGAKLFRSFAPTIGIDDGLIETGAMLIRHHILMSNVAQREDIYNEKTIFSFVALLKEKKTIDMLYLLTYADINGVGEGVYTSFTAELLKELYTRAIRVIDRKELLDEAATRRHRENILKKHSGFLALPRAIQKKILGITSSLFFIKNKSDAILDIAGRVLQTQGIRFDYHNESRFIMEIFAKQEINLGWLLGKLTFLDITDMDIFKLFDGTKYFRIAFETTVETDSIPVIDDLVRRSADMSLKANYARPTLGADEIAIDCNHSNDYASMTLVTKNQKGLMAYVIEVFDSYGIDIATAKISTIKETARDLFVIEKNSGFCRSKEKVLAALTR